MRILFVTERIAPQRGGVAKAAARQVQNLAPQLDRIDIMHLSDDLEPGQVTQSPFSPETQNAWIHSIGTAKRNEESLHLLMEAALAQHTAHNHNLVHGFYAVPAGYVATLAAKRMGVPSVVSLRGNDLDLGLFQPARVGFLRWTLEHADAVVGVTTELADKARAFSGRTEGVSSIFNGVDADVFAPSSTPLSNLDSFSHLPRPWIGFSGELRFKKGLNALLELACDLERRNAGTLFALGGVRRDERTHVKQWRLANPQAAKRLVSLNYTHDTAELNAWYQHMDVMAFPSLWDGLPNALLEAMACGRPVVATAVGGIVDVVEHNKNGWLVPLSELNSFSEQVHKVLAWSDKDRLAMGNLARERVVQDFSRDKEREATLHLYRQLTGQKG